MLIAISHYTKPAEEVDKHRPAHRQFLAGLLAENKLLVSGRQNPSTGGVIIVKMDSVDEFRKILDQDPFSLAGVAEYKIIAVNPTLYHESLRNLFE